VGRAEVAAPAASPPPVRAGAGAPDVGRSVVVGGVTRTFLVHVPPVYDGRTPVAVVIAGIWYNTGRSGPPTPIEILPPYVALIIYI
jgi:hypothetical protein